MENEMNVRENTESNTLSASAYDVLNSLFNPSETVCLRVFSDKKDGVFTGTKLSCICREYPKIEKNLKDHNDLGRGISFIVNFGGQTDAEIKRINAQFVDIDKGSFEEQKKKIDGFPLPPSMLIKTDKSYHVYWFVKGAKVERFRPLQKQLCVYFQADFACINESRAMRLPGFKHCKKDTPVDVVCESFHPERQYTQDQLADVLPDMPQAQAPVAKNSGDNKGIELVELACDFIQHCKKDAATLSEQEWYEMICILANFEGGADKIHEYSKPYPGYNAGLTQRKINHYLNSGARPTRCETICEKGFHCPKFANGGCGVKSPAALCYRPLEKDVLIDMIDHLPLSADPLENMQSAQVFIEKYLCNQDALTANYLIDSCLAKHFNISEKYLKILRAAYRGQSKRRENSKKKNDHTDENLPDWYIETSKGVRFLPGVLGQYLAETKHVFYAGEQHYIYQDGVYRAMSEMAAQKIVQDEMLAKETRMSQITDAEKQWRLRIQRDVKDLNSNPYIINVKNGLYNVMENTLTEHTPDYYSTIQLNVDYDIKADCPLFKQFLSDSMEGDMGQVRLIQEILGYCTIPDGRLQKCIVFVGEPSAGKSLLLRVLNEILLGRENVSNVTWQALNERFKIAELVDKLANIFADLPSKNFDDNGIFKALVGEDFLTVERKNKNPFSFQNTARLIFSCNSIPKNYGDKSEGFYRRLTIIRFKHSVPPEKRDPDLLDKFRTEADGIFAFALEGLRRLINNNFHLSEEQTNIDELQRYREESDSVLSFVCDECQLFPGGDRSVHSTDLYNAYKQYCEENGLHSYGQKAFVQKILNSYRNVTRGMDSVARLRTLNGICLNEIPD